MMLRTVKNFANFNSLIFVFQLYLMVYIIINIGVAHANKNSPLKKKPDREGMSMKVFLKMLLKILLKP